MALFQGITSGRVKEFLSKIKSDCSNDSLLTAKKLIEVGCSLTHALILKDAKITEYMLDNGYDVNEINVYNNTPLHEAAWNSDLQNVKLLVSRGANMNALNVFSATPLENLLSHSIKYPHEKDEILKFLLDQGAQFTVDSMAYLFSFAKKIDIIRRFLDYNVDFVTKTRKGYNLLHAIAGNENFDPVEILKGQKLNINDASLCGITALMKAACAGNVNTVEYLLTQGAEVNVTFCNRTVLVRTFIPVNTRRMRKRRTKIIELLLQYGTDPQYGNYQEIFDIVLKGKKFALIKPYLAHLALIEELGVKIREEIHDKINSHAMFQNYFGMCKRKIEKMKRTVIYHSVTLFKFLTVSEQKVIKFAGNDKLLSRLKVILYNKRGSKFYYYNVLRRRMTIAMRVMNLRKVALDIISRIDELRNNAVIVEKIVDYFNIDGLKNMTPL